MNAYRDFVEFDGVGRADAPCRVLSLMGAGARPEGLEDELQFSCTRWHSHSQVCFVKLGSSIDTASTLISFFNDLLRRTSTSSWSAWQSTGLSSCLCWDFVGLL